MTGKLCLDDEAAWREQLQRKGFVVVGGVLGAAEVAAGRTLLWEWLEGLGSGLQRGQPETWGDAAWPGDLPTGIVTGAAHSPAAWHLRTRPGVLRAFSALWGTKDLISSMDCLLLWRPWGGRPAWRPVTEGLHIDQNPFHKRGLQCVQGMLPLVPVTGRVGGLQVRVLI
jgi:hypothetical protein